MKRLALAVALALCAVPALADERAPFEQTQLDRALVDMPGIDTSERVQVAQLGGMSYRSGGDSETDSQSPWANDHNFIAPAQ